MMHVVPEIGINDGYTGNTQIVVSPNPNLLLLVQLISRLADTFDMFLIQSGILARGVEVEVEQLARSMVTIYISSNCDKYYLTC